MTGPGVRSPAWPPSQPIVEVVEEEEETHGDKGSAVARPSCVKAVGPPSSSDGHDNKNVKKTGNFDHVGLTKNRIGAAGTPPPMGSAVDMSVQPVATLSTRPNTDSPAVGGSGSRLDTAVSGRSTTDDGASMRSARDFEDLIQSDETLQYTLTPESMRDNDVSLRFVICALYVACYGEM